MADAESHRSVVERVLCDSSTEAVELLFVDSVRAWWHARGGHARADPLAMPIRDRSTGAAGVRLRRTIDAAAVAGILDRLRLCGFDAVVPCLVSAEPFLKHLMLHELAHLLNDRGQDKEDEGDEWACRTSGWLPPAA